MIRDMDKDENERRYLHRRFNEIEISYRECIEPFLGLKARFYEIAMPEVWMDDTGIHHKWNFDEQTLSAMASIDEQIAELWAKCRKEQAPYTERLMQMKESNIDFAKLAEPMIIAGMKGIEN